MSPHLVRPVHPLAAANPSSFTWALCMTCEAVFHFNFLLPAPVEEVAAAMKKVRCPGCGAKSSGITFCPENKLEMALAAGKESSHDTTR